jgi:hypothetical protein
MSSFINFSGLPAVFQTQYVPFVCLNLKGLGHQIDFKYIDNNLQI